MHTALRPVLACAVLLAGVADLRATEITANNPLAAPLFSLDPNSPEIDPNQLHSGDLLWPEPNRPLPGIIVPAENLGLDPNDPHDNVNGLSLQAWPAEAETFVLIFSVDRAAIGGTPPDPFLVSLGYPFNMQDQAAKGQAAGDAYMSLLLFDRAGPVPPWQPGQVWSTNNTLAVNQGDAGGVDFRISPRDLPPDQSAPPGSQQSEADGGSSTQPQSWPCGPCDGKAPQPPFEWILFSLARGSPALNRLPGTGSGADVYIDSDPNAPGGERLYVAGPELGLFYPDDDIDGLLVFDDGDGVFTPGLDQVLFSLDPLSPSLAGAGPGDLFSSRGMGVFELYAAAEELGLDRGDNLDLLDFVPCEHILSCIYDWAIGYVGSCTGDINGDGQIDAADLSILLGAYNTCRGEPDYYPGADLTGDDCVGLADLATLLARYGEPCP